MESFGEDFQNLTLHELHQGQRQLKRQQEVQMSKGPQFCPQLKCPTFCLQPKTPNLPAPPPYRPPQSPSSPDPQPAHSPPH